MLYQVANRLGIVKALGVMRNGLLALWLVMARLIDQGSRLSAVRGTRKAIRRGSFKSTRQLAEKIDQFVKGYNRNSKPFIWTATAESIFEKLERLCKN